MGKVLTCIRAFLTNKSMKVVVAGTSSSPSPVTSGVPRGSVLGHLLSLVYMNYKATRLVSNAKILAEDVELYFIIIPKHVSSALVDISVVQRHFHNSR